MKSTNLKEHIRRFQEYFIHMHILMGSNALQFWHQNKCKYPSFVCKTNRGDIKLHFKAYEKKILDGGAVEI